MISAPVDAIAYSIAPQSMLAPVMITIMIISSSSSSICIVIMMIVTVDIDIHTLLEHQYNLYVWGIDQVG